jgi:hypothetical protein
MLQNGRKIGNSNGDAAMGDSVRPMFISSTDIFTSTYTVSENIKTYFSIHFPHAFF